MNVVKMLLPHLCGQLACQVLDCCILLSRCWSGLARFPGFLLPRSVTALPAGAPQRVMCPTTLVQGRCGPVRRLPAASGVLAGHGLWHVIAVFSAGGEIGHTRRTLIY